MNYLPAADRDRGGTLTWRLTLPYVVLGLVLAAFGDHMFDSPLDFALALVVSAVLSKTVDRLTRRPRRPLPFTVDGRCLAIGGAEPGSGLAERCEHPVDHAGPHHGRPLWLLTWEDKEKAQ